MKGVGAKRFGMSFETQGKPNFLAGCPGIFVGISLGDARKVCEKRNVFNFPSLMSDPVRVL